MVDHLHGEKSGKKIGIKLNFVVKNAESKKNSIGYACGGPRNNLKNKLVLL